VTEPVVKKGGAQGMLKERSSGSTRRKASALLLPTTTARTFSCTTRG
jgi:hypothetical protein